MLKARHIGSQYHPELACVLQFPLSLFAPSQSPTLQELYLSQTGLSGALPDSVPRNSSLQAFFAIGLTDQQRPDPTNPGFTGTVHS